MKRDDTLWKGILENVFDDFLRFFFEGAENLFDFNKGFQFLDKELEQLFPAEDIGHPKFVDKLVKVFTKEGKDEWILVHVEVQGYRDDNFPLRMFTYFYRILDKYKRQVAAIAILTDTDKKFRPASYHYNFLATTNTFNFNTYKIIDQQEEALEKNGNPFALIILTVLLIIKQKPLTDGDLFSVKLKMVRNLQKHNIPETKRRALMNFLKFYGAFANPEFNAKFDEAILIINKNKKTMGIEEMLIERFKKEGREEGREEALQEAKLSFVKNLLLNTNFTVTKIATLANVTEDFVRKVKKSLK